MIDFYEERGLKWKYTKSIRKRRLSSGLICFRFDILKCITWAILVRRFGNLAIFKSVKILKRRPRDKHLFRIILPNFIIQVRPDLNLDQNRLLNPIFYDSRRLIEIDSMSIPKYHFDSTCSQSKPSDNKSRIGEKWLWKSVCSK